jgi:hypothetical protein
MTVVKINSDAKTRVDRLLRRSTMEFIANESLAKKSVELFMSSSSTDFQKGSASEITPSFKRAS